MQTLNSYSDTSTVSPSRMGTRKKTMPFRMHAQGSAHSSWPARSYIPARNRVRMYAAAVDWAAFERVFYTVQSEQISGAEELSESARAAHACRTKYGRNRLVVGNRGPNIQ